ncbi:MAG: alanine--tRNA ligase [Clostridiaceae bacterium]|nr:alanine--tRNA ligase [Clostridiaceae bacterium]
MQPLSLNIIREKYLAFFESKGHLRLPSFSLVPRNDPSILLINAGMTPLKPYFTGARTPPSLRVTTCQKCIRTPDIERVGKTARHGTFFEMLGNFSFGDYFKKEIIPWAWEFCTEILEMPADRLYVTVYQDDDEAYAIWRDDVGLPPERIFRMGKEDNFWEHGTGPCGPCSEIHYDRGPEYGCGKPGCQVGCDCDRYVEFWNLVFTQFNREEDGSYTPLAKKNIDTGAGLERLACIMQNVDNLFEVDTIRAILDETCRMTGVVYGRNEKTDTAIRVITDHIRSTTMMISDGIIPSNEGRGYVLRRLLRRAARFGRILGLSRPFLFELAQTVIRESSGAYPELKERQDYITRVVRMEEERFAETIQQGSAILDGYLSQARQNGNTCLSGEEVFRLHDTYGFPLDLTREIAAEQGVDLDEEGFRAEMNRQKEAARKALREKAGSAWAQAALPEGINRRLATGFTGYDTLEQKATVLYLLQTGADGAHNLTDTAETGEAVTVITDRTSFYAASGGQTGDIGQILTDHGRLSVQDTTKTPDGLYLHLALVEEGSISSGDEAVMQVDRQTRLATARNHTTTHLLHRALRLVLGDHIAQAGSSVSPERLRFDFSHFQPLTADEKRTVEQMVNEAIIRNDPVTTTVMALDEARATGATALFDEKYGDQVRVVAIGEFSKELCGGTHLRESAEACQFRLVSEGGVAAGIRRIEGVTGLGAWQIARQQDQLLQDAGALLRAPHAELPHRIDALLEKVRILEKEREAEQKKQIAETAGQLADQAVDIQGVPLVLASISVADAEQLREAADRIRDRIGQGVVILAASIQGKAAWVAMAGKDAVGRGLHAGNLVREAASLTGGGGGGRPDMAQAGGRQPERIPEALAVLRRNIEQQLGV